MLSYIYSLQKLRPTHEEGSRVHLVQIALRRDEAQGRMRRRPGGSQGVARHLSDFEEVADWELPILAEALKCIQSLRDAGYSESDIHLNLEKLLTSIAVDGGVRPVYER